MVNKLLVWEDYRKLEKSVSIMQDHLTTLAKDGLYVHNVSIVGSIVSELGRLLASLGNKDVSKAAANLLQTSLILSKIDIEEK
jgi:hypothetical protein